MQLLEQEFERVGNFLSKITGYQLLFRYLKSTTNTGTT